MRVLYGAAKILQASLPLLGWWVLGMDRRPAWRGRRGAVLAGILTGIAVGALNLAAYASPLGAWAPIATAPGRILQTLVAFDLATPARYLALALGLSLAHSLFEEYYWRWFLLDQLQRRLPAPLALTLASLAFASHHFIVVDSFLGGAHRLTVTLPATLGVAVVGALWGWLFDRYRTLLAPWISHLLVDAAVMAIGWQMVFGTARGG
jgi:membrane protease YdiL (CAAX protease family)